MRIVIGLQDFSSFAGTETYTRTVASELMRLGHEVIIHAPLTGEIAELTRKQGIAVVESKADLPTSCDAVLSQDAASAFALAGRFPDARRLMVVHSDYFLQQSPPQLSGVNDALIVLNDRVGSFVESLASPGGGAPILRMTQPVDLKRFGVRGQRDGGTPRALVLGNYLSPSTAAVLAEICGEAGLEALIHGAGSNPLTAPEEAMADADVVIGLGRCIVEAMAGGRAAYVYGITGLDGWVTTESYEALEADGFGATASPSVLDRNALVADLARMSPEMGPLNRKIASTRHDAGAHAVKLVEYLRGIPDESRPALTNAEELARLVGAESLSWSRYSESLQEIRRLRHELGAAEALLASRRYRIGSRLASPLDALRRRGDR